MGCRESAVAATLSMRLLPSRMCDLTSFEACGFATGGVIHVSIRHLHRRVRAQSLDFARVVGTRAVPGLQRSWSCFGLNSLSSCSWGCDDQRLASITRSYSHSFPKPSPKRTELRPVLAGSPLQTTRPSPPNPGIPLRRRSVGVFVHSRYTYNTVPCRFERLAKIPIGAPTHLQRSAPVSAKKDPGPGRRRRDHYGADRVIPAGRLSPYPFSGRLGSPRHIPTTAQGGSREPSRRIPAPLQTRAPPRAQCAQVPPFPGGACPEATDCGRCHPIIIRERQRSD